MEVFVSLISVLQVDCQSAFKRSSSDILNALLNFHTQLIIIPAHIPLGDKIREGLNIRSSCLSPFNDPVLSVCKV